MGLVYSPSESEGLVNALRSNIATAQTMIDDMNSASKHLVDAVNGKTLSGAAYTAGKGLFMELVIPTISKVAATVDKLRKKLSQYEGYAGAAGNELLDEDKLNRQLELLRQQQASMTSQINFYRMQSYLYPEEAELNQMYANFQWELSNYLNTIADDIQKTQDKLKRLHEFNGNVNGLFSGTLDELKTVLQIMLAITVDTAGSYALAFNNSKEFKKFKELANSGGLPKEIAKSVLSQGVVSKAIKQVGQGYRVAGIRKGSLGATEGALSRTALRARGMQEFGADLIDVGKGIGKSKVFKVAGFLGTALDVGLDYDDQMSKYNDIGRAVKNTGAHLGINMIAGSIGSAAGTEIGAYLGGALGTLIPIPGLGTALGTVAGAALGAAIGYGANKVYDWVESGEAGKFIDNTAKNISKGVNNLKNKAGEVFAGFGKSLGSVFG